MLWIHLTWILDLVIVVGGFGKKYDDLKKPAKVEKWGQRGNFHYTWGENISLEKGGKNFNYLDNIHPC